MTNNMSISTYTLNHFGIVAGTCKELRICEITDSLVVPDPQQKVTTGQALVAMIINGLGFSNRRLYLFPQFFEKKPVDILVGEDIDADDLNDDVIGRALDRMFEYGCTELFCHLAFMAAKSAEVERKFGHLDTTTFSVHGEYKSSSVEGAAIHITKGHSKQKRPDLNQVFLNLLVSSDGGIPLFMQALNGNSSDVTTFRKTVTEFRRGLKENLQEIVYWVADSKFYTEDTLKETKSDLLWISRVPDNIKEARELIASTAESMDDLTPLGSEGYSYRRHTSMYANVKQRWLVIHSTAAEKRAMYTVKRSVKKESDRLRKISKKWQKKEFNSEDKARKSVESLQKKAKFHKIGIDSITSTVRYKSRGRPPKDKEKRKKRKKVLYHVCYSVSRDQYSIDIEIKRKAIFIVATNETSKGKLTDLEVFENYKGQKHVERGFRFLKDPLFFASSLFLKKPERIVALTMVMCMSLLVYSICERKMRNLLKEYGKTIMNQVGKPTQRPTLRWIFQLFEDVPHVLHRLDKLCIFMS